VSRPRQGGWAGSQPVPVLVAAVLVLLAGCATDAGPVYRQSAVSVLEATLGEGRTAELAGRLWVEHRSTHALTVVVVGESDTGVGAETDWFEQLQPPGVVGDRVRERTVEALDATASAVQEVRISLERSDRPGVRAALDDLHSACDDLESLAEDLS
jgi:hypothetical protein